MCVVVRDSIFYISSFSHTLFGMMYVKMSGEACPYQVGDGTTIKEKEQCGIIKHGGFNLNTSFASVK